MLATAELQQTYRLGPGWVTVKTVSWETARFDFVNDFEGWAIVSSGPESALVQTINGGYTWIEIKPVIAP